MTTMTTICSGSDCSQLGRACVRELQLASVPNILHALRGFMFKRTLMNSPLVMGGNRLIERVQACSVVQYSVRPPDRRRAPVKYTRPTIIHFQSGLVKSPTSSNLRVVLHHQRRADVRTDGRRLGTMSNRSRRQISL
jgi:hypothetical protein